MSSRYAKNIPGYLALLSISDNLVKKLLFFVLLFMISTSAANAGYVYHKVKKKENLTVISKRYKTSIDNIIKLNKLKSANDIKAGQKLKVKTVSDKQADIPAKKFYAPLPHSKLLRRYIPWGDTRNLGYLLKSNQRSSVRAADSGVVTKISELRGYGKYILVDHGSGWITMYSHMGQIKVKRGDKISRKQTLGNLEKNYLFFLVSFRGEPVNPGDFIRG